MNPTNTDFRVAMSTEWAIKTCPMVITVCAENSKNFTKVTIKFKSISEQVDSRERRTAKGKGKRTHQKFKTHSISQRMFCTVSMSVKRSQAERWVFAHHEGKSSEDTGMGGTLCIIIEHKPLFLILLDKTNQTQAASPRNTEPTQLTTSYSGDGFQGNVHF